MVPVHAVPSGHAREQALENGGTVATEHAASNATEHAAERPATEPTHGALECSQSSKQTPQTSAGDLHLPQVLEKGDCIGSQSASRSRT